MKTIKLQSLRPIYLGIFILCFVFYGNTLFNQYSIDDTLINNKYVDEGLKNIPTVLTNRLDLKLQENVKDKSPYRPLVTVSYILEISVLGKSPFCSHLINILLYVICCILVVKVLLILLGKRYFTLIILTTIIFLIHPIHTEVVNNLKSRDELLSFILVMLSFYFYLKSFIRKDRSMLYQILGFVAIFFSFFAKITSVYFIFIIPIAFFILKKISIKQLLIITTQLILAFISYIGWIKFMGIAKGKAGIKFSYYTAPLLYEKGLDVLIPNVFNTTYHYIYLLFYPHPLLCFYGYDTVHFIGFKHPIFWLTALVCLIALVVALLNIKKEKILAFGILGLAICLGIYSNLLLKAPGIIADRFMFSAVLFFGLILAFLIFKLFKIPIKNDTSNLQINYNYYSLILILFMIFLSSLKVIDRNQDWYNGRTILERDVKYGEDSFKLNFMMGNEYFKDVKKDPNPETIAKAEKYYLKANSIYDGVSSSWNNLAFLQFLKNDFQNAEKYFLEAIHRDSNRVTSWFNLAKAKEKLGKYNEAITCYDIVLKKDTVIKSFIKESLLNKSRLHNTVKNFSQQENTLKEAIDLFPEQIAFYDEMARLLFTQSKYNEAFSYWDKAIEKRIYNSQMIQNIIMACEAINKPDRAEYYRRFLIK